MDLMEDKLWSSQKDRSGELIRTRVAKMATNGSKRGKHVAPLPPNGKQPEPSPQDSLEGFLKFCGKNYPARHYMLFILGHGLIVGNDVFLFDEHAEKQSLSLGELRDVLARFKDEYMPPRGPPRARPHVRLRHHFGFLQNTVQMREHGNHAPLPREAGSASYICTTDLFTTVVFNRRYDV